MGRKITYDVWTKYDYCVQKTHLFSIKLRDPVIGKKIIKKKKTYYIKEIDDKLNITV